MGQGSGGKELTSQILLFFFNVWKYIVMYKHMDEVGHWNMGIPLNDMVS